MTLGCTRRMKGTNRSCFSKVQLQAEQRQSVTCASFCLLPLLARPVVHSRLCRACVILCIDRNNSLWVKNRYPKWNPSKWKHGSKLSVRWWFNFDHTQFNWRKRRCGACSCWGRRVGALAQGLQAMGARGFNWSAGPGAAPAGLLLLPVSLLVSGFRQGPKEVRHWPMAELRSKWESAVLKLSRLAKG